MNTTTPPRPGAGSGPTAPRRDDPRRFAVRVKRWTVGFTVAGVGLVWALVSQNVVGATNAAPAAAAPAATASPARVTPGRASVPSPDFFGQPNAQPQPIIGNPGNAGPAPVVRGRTS